MDEEFGGDCHNRPSEALSFGLGWLQAALQASPSLAWSCSQFAISDGGFGRLGAISQPLYAGGMSLPVDTVGAGMRSGSTLSLQKMR